MSLFAGDTSPWELEAPAHSPQAIPSPPFQADHLPLPNHPSPSVGPTSPNVAQPSLGPGDDEPLETAASTLDEDHLQDADESNISEVDAEEDEEVLNEEGVSDRPNKYQGPASTWRDWTREERLLSASLNQLRAGDLSVHLYNAHKLKQRLRTASTSQIKPWHNKKLWIDEQKRKEWYPNDAWTAWPLKAEDVPTAAERFGSDWNDQDEKWTITGEDVEVKPSAELEELLTAAVLRAAKERFKRREEETIVEPGEVNSLEVDSAEVSGGSSPSQRDGSPESHDSDVFASGQKKKNEISHPDNPVSLKSDEEAVIQSLEQQEDVKLPVLMADDRKAQTILTPTLRSLLGRFDTMLMGLHHARQAYASKRVIVRNSNKESSGKKNASRQPGPHHEAITNASESSSEEAIASTSSSNVATSPSSSWSTPSRESRRSSSTRNTKSSPRALPRDWRDVLGVASMQGCSPAVIHRTAQRCADLFGESMSFMALNEAIAGTSDLSPVTYAPGSNVPFPSPPERMRASTPEVTSLQPTLRLIPGSLRCPYPDCNRHDNPYPAAHRLRQHMKKTHGYDPKRKEAAKAEDMFGGVHVDGFLQLIEARPGWRGKDSTKRKARGTVEEGERARGVKRRRRQGSCGTES